MKELLNNEINKCDELIGKESCEDCDSKWTSSIMIDHILKNIKLKNPYSLNKQLIQSSSDPRIDAEGKAGQSTNKGVIFVSLNDFSEPDLNGLWYMCKITLCCSRK